MMKIYMKTVKDRELREIKRFKSGCWISLINPSLEELRKIKNELKIPSDFLVSPLDEDERPRVEKKREDLDNHKGSVQAFGKWRAGSDNNPAWDNNLEELHFNGL